MCQQQKLLLILAVFLPLILSQTPSNPTLTSYSSTYSSSYNSSSGSSGQTGASSLGTPSFTSTGSILSNNVLTPTSTSNYPWTSSSFANILAQLNPSTASSGNGQSSGSSSLTSTTSTSSTNSV